MLLLSDERLHLAGLAFSSTVSVRVYGPLVFSSDGLATPQLLEQRGHLRALAWRATREDLLHVLFLLLFGQFFLFLFTLFFAFFPIGIFTTALFCVIVLVD